MLGEHVMISVAVPDGYVLAKLGNQSQRGIQLIILIVGHVGHNHYHEPSRAARVHTSHYPILWKGTTNAVLQRSSESQSKKTHYQCFESCWHLWHITNYSHLEKIVMCENAGRSLGLNDSVWLFVNRQLGQRLGHKEQTGRLLSLLTVTPSSVVRNWGPSNAVY